MVNLELKVNEYLNDTYLPYKKADNVYNEVIDIVGKAVIHNALKRFNGVQERTADFLGINRNTLYAYMKKHGLSSYDYR